MKKCAKCNAVKTPAEFSKDRARRDGLQPHCRQCQAAARKKNRDANKERESARAKQYRAANMEMLAEIGRRWRALNGDSIAERLRRWREQNRERVRARDRERLLKNRPAVVAARMRRRTRKLNAIPSWFGDLDAFVMQEAADLCRLREASTGFPWEVDHMIPLQSETASGLHIASNVQVIPKILNRSKRNTMTLTEQREWLKVAA